MCIISLFHEKHSWEEWCDMRLCKRSSFDSWLSLGTAVVVIDSYTRTPTQKKSTAQQDLSSPWGNKTSHLLLATVLVRVSQTPTLHRHTHSHMQTHHIQLNFLPYHTPCPTPPTSVYTCFPFTTRLSCSLSLCATFCHLVQCVKPQYTPVMDVCALHMDLGNRDSFRPHQS